MTHRWLLVLACAMVSACGPDIPPPSVLPPTPSILPSPVAGQALVWTRAELPDTAINWIVSGVIADPDGFVVYGSATDRAAVWTSADGVTWQSMALPGFAQPDGGSPSHAAMSGDATVLVGVGGSSQCAHPSREYIWRRVHGDAGWAAAPFVENLFCLGGIPDLAANDDTFVVAGTSSGETPFAWRSIDGLAWHDTGRGLPADSPPTLVTTTDAGFLLVGRGSRTDAEASVDGSSWTPVEAPPVPPAFNPVGDGMTAAALVPTAGGPLAIYESDDATVLSAWRRLADGTWEEVPLGALGPGAGVTDGVTIDGLSYLLLIRDGRAGLVSSTDLTTWTDIAVPPMDSISGIATFGGQAVLTGWVTVNQEPMPQVWTAPAP